MINVLILIFVLLFALNLGGGNFAASFLAARGGRVISHLKSSILFLVFAVAGAVILGGPVTRTLSWDIVSSRFLSPDVCLVILIAATGSLFTVNRHHLPQSLVMVKMASLFAIGSLKDKDRVTWKNPLIVKTSLSWGVMPVTAAVGSYLLIGGWRALSA